VRLLDSDVLIDIRRRFPPAVAWLSGLTERPGLPGHVVMELVEGCRDGREVRRLLREITPFRIYWPTQADQERALGTYSRAHLAHGLGMLDALIGECAVGLSATLCTFNIRHFRAVPGLVTEQPYLRR
jgi:predicted nucleic acid-binding protein